MTSRCLFMMGALLFAGASGACGETASVPTAGDTFVQDAGVPPGFCHGPAAKVEVNGGPAVLKDGHACTFAVLDPCYTTAEGTVECGTGYRLQASLSFLLAVDGADRFLEVIRESRNDQPARADEWSIGYYSCASSSGCPAAFELSGSTAEIQGEAEVELQLSPAQSSHELEVCLSVVSHGAGSALQSLRLYHPGAGHP